MIAKNKYRKLSLLVILLTIFCIYTTTSFAGAEEASENPLNFDEDTSMYRGTADAVPSGEEYILYEEWGGTWYDAEKTIADTDDDLMCWAAASANVLRWTNWGTVNGWTTEDEMFEHFNDHWEDQGGLSRIGWQWWLQGNVPGDYPNDPPYIGGPASWSEVDVGGGGGFWTGPPAYAYGDYYHEEHDDADALDAIYDYLHDGYGIALGIYTAGGGGHAITCWGVNYNPDDHSEFYGIWVTDSDDDKSDPGSNPPDAIHYYEVELSGGSWYLQDLYGTDDWYISIVQAFEPFPNHAPVADANGPYTDDEGTSVGFDGTGSNDQDGHTLQYRWDFENNGVWDTDWSTSPLASHTYGDDFSGLVKLEVYDGELYDTDTASVTVNNVAPSITTISGAVIDENGEATVSGTFTDPGSLDSFTVTIDWGDGSVVDYGYLTGSTAFSESHQYLDDDPTVTPYDDYTVIVTLKDDDTGQDTDKATVTVNNVPPVITVFSMEQPNPQFILPLVHELTFHGDYSDVGTLDTHTVEWDLDDGTIVTGDLDPTHIYSMPGTYYVTLTVTDDDTGVDTETMEVVVYTAEEAKHDVLDYIKALPDTAFKKHPDKKKATLENIFMAIDDMLADLEYQGAISDLVNNVRAKADGTVDGLANNDWIVDSTAQTHICMKIDDLVAYLQLLF